MKETKPSTRRARWGLLLTSLLLGLLLIAIAALAQRSAKAGVKAMIQGQAEMFSRELGAWHRLQGRPLAKADLVAFLASHEEDGLSYLALVEDDGQVRFQAGDPVRERIDLPLERGPHVVDQRGDRTRVFSRAPLAGQPRSRPHMRNKGAPGDEIADRDPHSPPQDRGAAPPPRPPRGQPHRPGHLSPPVWTVQEFNPVAADELLGRARSTLVGSVAVALLLMASAAGFWRLSLRADAAQEAHEERQLLANLGEMSAVLAHEIRNPLASLKGHAQLLLEQLPKDGGERDNGERVVDEILRLEHLTTDLLDFVRSGRVQPTPVDPVGLLRECAEAIDTARFEIHAEPEAALFPLDRERMRQVLFNLLRNALQASPPDEPIRIVSSVDSSGLRIEVHNAGEGFALGEQERIFEAFHTTRVRGVGLGLAVARRIVHLHSGQIWASNHPEGGVVFTLTIPGAT